MFRELAPFLRNRAVLLTVTHLGDDHIRVNVVPKKLKDGENEALTTPLSVTGTAEELDEDLAKTLVNYVGSHLQLKNSLENAKALMDAAAKAAQEESRTKAKSADKPGKPQAAASPALETQESGTPVEAAKPALPATLGLFDVPTATAPATSITAQPLSAPENEDEAEILAEMDEHNPADDDELENAA